MDLPSPRHLLVAWTVLCLLTVASMVLGGLGTGLVGAVVVLVLTVVKARQVLDVYLNLRASTPAWRGVFTALVLLAAGFTLGSLLIAAAMD